MNDPTLFLDMVKPFTFSDGLPHVQVTLKTDHVACSIRSPEELFRLQLVHDVSPIKELTIHYLMGSRMDRAISEKEPNSLRVVAAAIKAMHVLRITCVFPHSPATMDRLECHHDTQFEMAFIWRGIQWMLNRFRAESFSLILPDSGAEKRFYNDHTKSLDYLKEGTYDVIACTKIRDMNTGKLSGFRVNSDRVYPNCIILDDLCDGGRTFSGISEELRKVGARNVGLIVYHGIFSKGFDIPGIDATYTSNSFKNITPTNNLVAEQVI